MIDPKKVNYVNPLKEKRIRGNIFTFCNKDNPSILEDPDMVKGTPGRNPFVGRSVALDLSIYKPSKENVHGDVQTFMEKVCQFLTTVGKEIWYLSVWFPLGEELEEDGDAVGPGPLHQKTLQFVTVGLLPLVPNLRELCIAMGWMDASRHQLPEAESLPSAPHLESLQVYYNGIRRDPLTSLLMERYRPQLRRLYVNASAASFPGFCNLEWPSLTELHVSSIEDLELLGGLNGTLMPQLSKLGLNLEEVGIGVTLNEVIASIRQLFPTTRLTTIRLEEGLEWLRMGRGQLGQNYAAPASITTLELDSHWAWNVGDEATTPFFTFLLEHFPMIENLHMFWRKAYGNNETEIDLRPREECLKMALRKGLPEFEIVEVYKYAFRGEMYRSNIWELFHQLKVLTFQWDVYTRAGFEEYQEKVKVHS